MIGLAAVLVLFSGSAQAASERETGDLVALLKSDSIEEREEASRRLIQSGEEALPALAKALREETDPELVGRTRDILRAIRRRVPVTIDLEESGKLAIRPSRAGRFVALLGQKSVRILESGTLKLLKEFALSVTAVGFDPTDAELTLVGPFVLVIGTDDWKEKFRASLPDAKFQREGQAWVSPGGNVFYRTSEGLLNVAAIGESSLETYSVGSGPHGAISRIFGRNGKWLFLSQGDSHETGAISNLRAVYGVAASSDVLVAGMVGGRGLFVCRDQISAYRSDTWKIIDTWAQTGNRAAALDVRGERIFVSDGHALKTLSAANPGKTAIYEPVRVAPLELAIDDEARWLYVISEAKGRKLHGWQLVD